MESLHFLYDTILKSINTFFIINAMKIFFSQDNFSQSKKKKMNNIFKNLNFIDC